jgi:hypothetical protein
MYLASCIRASKPQLTITNDILNSAIGYITPKEVLAGHQQETQADQDRKLGAEGNSARIAAGEPREV